MPKYQYAFKDGDPEQVVDALKLTSNAGCFACVICGDKLDAHAQGKKYIKHFAHRPTHTHAIHEKHEESYWHIVAKYVFLRTYRAQQTVAKPFEAEILHAIQCPKASSPVPAECCLPAEIHLYDLLSIFPSIKMEKRYDAFIPDLFLFDENDASRVLLVEIKVTNGVSSDKIKSGIPVLEIKVESEREIATIETAFLPHNIINPYNIGAVFAVPNKDRSCPCDTTKSTSSQDKGACIIALHPIASRDPFPSSLAIGMRNAVLKEVGRSEDGVLVIVERHQTGEYALYMHGSIKDTRRSLSHFQKLLKERDAISLKAKPPQQVTLEL